MEPILLSNPHLYSIFVDCPNIFLASFPLLDGYLNGITPGT